MHIGAESIDYTDSFFLSIDRFCKYITRNKPNLLPATIQKLRQFVTMFQTSLSDVDSNPSTVYIHLSPFLWSSSMFIRSGCCAAYLSSLLTCSMTHLLLSKHFTPSHKSFKTHPWIKSLVYPPSSSLPPSGNCCTIYGIRLGMILEFLHLPPKSFNLVNSTLSTSIGWVSVLKVNQSIFENNSFSLSARPYQETIVKHVHFCQH